MEHEIIGEDMPSLEIRLKHGEAVFTESGGMAWMSDSFDMKTTGGGIGRMLGRAMAGESLFLTTFTCTENQGTIVFTTPAPGHIIPMELGPNDTIIAQKGAFMCAEQGVEMTMHFRKRLGAGLFGGEGFILQRVTGPGTAFFEIDGEARSYTLKPGQRLKVDPGHVALFEPSVDFDIEMLRGVGNMLFGGEGLFLATLTGPGRVWLQTMPLSNLAGAIRRYIPTQSSS